MSRHLFVTWDGGGNLPPALGIARTLRDRGHSVRFLGQESQQSRIEAAGFAFAPYSSGPEREAAPPQTPAERQMRLMRSTWLNPGLAGDVFELLRREPADVVLVCSMLGGVLSRSAEFRVPTAVLVPGLYASILPMRDVMISFGNQLRTQAGLAPLDPGAMAWESKDLVVVTTVRELDGGTSDALPNVRYVGPVFDWTPVPSGWRLPWAADDPRPLVLVSFSTMSGQSSADRLQQVLDALADLPIRVVMTAGAVPTDALKRPANAAIYSFIPHSAILPDASLAITHSGHGSVAAALAHGVPLVCMPSVAADQPIIAGRVEALGAGVAIGADATGSEIRKAVSRVLATPSYRFAAQRLADSIRRYDGAAMGASALEALAPVMANNQQQR